MKLKRLTVERNSKPYPQGAVILEEDDFAEEMYLVIEGEVEIYKKIRTSRKTVYGARQRRFIGRNEHN